MHLGICPLKLSHVACLSPDVNRLVAFYTDVLGFRLSDSMQDFFYFLRCNPDHHTVNMVAGQYSAVQHLAFELTDVGHIRSACDALARHGTEVLWGPLRHGCGHNLAIYHTDPEGLLVEHCAELDRMSDDALGYFDPRPWHEDRPQRPKTWDPAAALSAWADSRYQSCLKPDWPRRRTAWLPTGRHDGGAHESGGGAAGRKAAQIRGLSVTRVR